jgi:hypothetical protein
MSLAASQNSWSSATVPSPVAPAVQSLTVNGVPITGLDGAGDHLSKQFSNEVISSLLPEDELHPKDGRLTVNEDAATAGFSDKVYLTPGTPAGGAFTYKYPVQFTEVPTLFFGNPLGGESVILTEVTETQCSGSMRFLSAQNNSFNITSGVQSYVPAPVSITFPGWSPTAGASPTRPNPPLPFTAFAVGTNGQTVITTPADLSPETASFLRLSWGNPVNSAQFLGASPNGALGIGYLPWTISVALTAPGLPSVTVASWNVPALSNTDGGRAPNEQQYNTNGGIGNKDWNQYQNVSVQLEPAQTYTVQVSVNAVPPPGRAVASGDFGIFLDLSSLTYYPSATPPTLSALSAPAPAVPTSSFASAPAPASAQRVLRYA